MLYKQKITELLCCIFTVKLYRFFKEVTLAEGLTLFRVKMESFSTAKELPSTIHAICNCNLTFVEVSKLHNRLRSSYAFCLENDDRYMQTFSKAQAKHWLLDVITI